MSLAICYALTKFLSSSFERSPLSDLQSEQRNKYHNISYCLVMLYLSDLRKLGSAVGLTGPFLPIEKQALSWNLGVFTQEDTHAFVYIFNCFI